MTGTWASLVASLRSWGSRVRGEAELGKRKAAKLPSESRRVTIIFTVRRWSVMFRLYGPLEPWFDKSWRRGEPELVK